MKNKKGFILSTYVYILLVFFLLLLSTMLAVLNNTRLLSKKLKEQSSNTSGLVNKDFSFVLLGDKEILLGKGEEFVDPGYIIKSSGGNDLSYKVKKTGKVNSNLVGIYELTYTATYNGVTKTISRIVKVGGTAVDLIESLATESNTEGLITDDFGNTRYTGASPKNYIRFNDEDWRIIGIFNMTTASGTTEKLVKIVRNESIGSYGWDSSASGVNSGNGVNEWSQADLKTELNTLYLNSQSGTCYSGKSNATTTCNFTNTGIKEAYRGMIESVVWNTGAVTSDSNGVSAIASYEAERGTKTGKICTGGTTCNDSVARTTTWQGLVGLIYPSDYAYASTNGACRSNLNDDSSYPCKNDNWLHNGYSWTITPLAASDAADNAWSVQTNGYVYTPDVYGGHGVRPTIYLKSNVIITGGDGASSATAYQISMSS